MKFDHIIMNPPYCRNLHLKILNEAICYSDDIVNLSPIRWLQDPLAEYKRNSDWNKFENIREKIEILEVVDTKVVGKLFSVNLTSDVGIYHLTKNGGANIKNKNTILDKLMKSGSFCVPVTSVDKVTKNIYCLVKTLVGGHRECACPAESIYDFIRNENYYGRYYENGISTNGMTLAENKAYNKKSTSGNIEKWACVEFDSKEEAENFFKFTKTKFFKYIYKTEMVDINVRTTLLPYMPTYTHPWTDEMLYEHFNLSEDEIRIIESEIK